MGLKLSPASIGVYSVCVDCNNSGQTSSGFFPNIGFLAGANTAAGASGNSPWGVAFESGAGGALTGMILNATANAASTDAQQIEQCAINSAGTPVCSFLSTTHLSAFTVASPGVTTVTNAVGLQANHYGGLASAPAPVPAAGGAITTTPTLTGNDFQGSISIPSTKVSFATSNNLVVVTFGTSYGSAPVCLVSENSNPIIGVGHLALAAGSLTITASIANPTASAYNIDYFCSGN